MASFEPQISVIVVSYNTRAMTLTCLGSVLAGTRAPVELIVIDNASTDGSAAAIAGAFPDVTLIAEGENHGFAGAHRIAVARARAQVLLLLNPDTEVPEGALDRLLAFARRVSEVGIWGGRARRRGGGPWAGPRRQHGAGVERSDPPSPLRCQLQGLSFFDGPYREVMIGKNAIAVRR